MFVLAPSEVCKKGLRKLSCALLRVCCYKRREKNSRCLSAAIVIQYIRWMFWSLMYVKRRIIRFVHRLVVNESSETIKDSNLVDSASSHTLVSKIKPCMSKYKRFILWNCEWLIISVIDYSIISYYLDNRSNSRANTCINAQLYWRAVFIRYETNSLRWFVVIHNNFADRMALRRRRFIQISALSTIDGRIEAYHGYNG